MSAHDSAFLADYLRQPALLDKALECTNHSLKRHFDPEHGFFEGYDETHPLPDGRYPPITVPDGEWVVGDFLYTSNASPEMTAYNIIGWVRALPCDESGHSDHGEDRDGLPLVP